MLIRSRWVARDFKEKGEKDREDLFSATPPLELMRYMLSRQATIRDDGQERKTMYLDVKKALFWHYGCRPAAQAWEDHYSAVLSKAGFKRLVSWLVACVHKSRDLMGRLRLRWAGCRLRLYFGGSASKLRVEEPWTARERRRGCKSDRHARQRAAIVRLGLDVASQQSP